MLSCVCATMTRNIVMGWFPRRSKVMPSESTDGIFTIGASSMSMSSTSTLDVADVNNVSYLVTPSVGPET